MGREVRMVPENWVHPRNEKGDYEPLHDNLCKRVSDYYRELAMWNIGYCSDFSTYPELSFKKKDETEEAYSFDGWSGGPLDPKDYMPDWAPEGRTHLQMYETCTEGTPISPVMKTPEELAQWLTDNNASAFGYEGATYDQWLSTIQRGFAVSAMMTVSSDGNSVLESGVAGVVKS